MTLRGDSRRSSLRMSITLNHLDAVGTTVLRPEMTGGIVGDAIVRSGMAPANVIVTEKTEAMTVTYNCYSSGGHGIMWLTLHIEASEAKEACGVDADMSVYIVWSKACRSELSKRTGIAVGTERDSDDVVSNGVVLRDWTSDFDIRGRDDSFEKVVLSSVSDSTFFVRTSDDSRQVFGPPRFETDETRVIVMLASAHDGGVATKEPQAIEVEYLCDRAASATVDVTMIVDLCADNVPSAQCDGTANYGYDPLVIHWKKNCGVADGSSFWFSDLLIIFLLAGTILWIFGCCFNYSVKHERGIDVVPGGRSIEAFVKDALRHGASVYENRRTQYHVTSGADDDAEYYEPGSMSSSTAGRTGAGGREHAAFQGTSNFDEDEEGDLSETEF
eukprot:g3212.t1